MTEKKIINLCQNCSKLFYADKPLMFCRRECRKLHFMIKGNALHSRKYSVFHRNASKHKTLLNYS